MKTKTIISVMALGAVLTGCKNYDDDIDNLDHRVAIVEQLQDRLAEGVSVTVTGARVDDAQDGARLVVSATATGFDPAQSYAAALDVEADNASYRTAYTPVWVVMSNPTVTITAADGTEENDMQAPGWTVQLVAKVKAGDAVALWTSSNKAVGTIDQDGFVEMKGRGKVTFTVITVQGAQDTFTLLCSDGTNGAND